MPPKVVHLLKSTQSAGGTTQSKTWRELLLGELKTKQLGLLKREGTELKLIEMRDYLLRKLSEKGMNHLPSYCSQV
jgi:hypothetical protein